MSGGRALVGRWAGWFGVLAAVSLAIACAPEPSGPVNLVLLSLDTTRRDHLPFYGYAKDTAPRMAALAASGVVFDDASAVHTNTAPAHASMLTGRYPMQHGIERNGQRLRDDLPTLAGILAARGYETAAFISGWTLTRHTGLDRGFAHFDQALREERRRAAEHTVEAALPWVEARATGDAPFFLFVHLFDPHWAYAPPEVDARRFLSGRAFTTSPETRPPGPAQDFAFTVAEVEEIVARYDGEIVYADRHLGRLLDALAARGLAENTLVVFTSDHGETLHERAWVFDHGARVYDEQVRIPLVMRLPGGQWGGSRVDAPVTQVDLVPTVLEVLGVEPPTGLPGRSLMPLLEAVSSVDRERPVFAHARPEADRVPELNSPLSASGLVSMVRVPGAKWIEYPTPDGFRGQLFDLTDDPGETHDVADARPALVASLRAKLAAFRRATGAERREPAPLTPEVEEALRDLGYLR